MDFTPKCSATAIGSMPHINAEAVCEFIFKALPEMPMWPQLPKRSWKESMNVQFSEGMPSLVIDDDNERIYFETQNDADMAMRVENFYADYISNCPLRFQISPEFADGLHAFTKYLSENQFAGKSYLKGHVVGPVTFGLSITDEKKQAILYNELLRDPVIKTLALKAAWQVNLFKKLRPQSQAIIFFDEPYLQSFGSAYISLGREEAVEMLNECFAAVDGLSGVHCCGNTDWSLLMETKVDILNFDAFDYLDNLVLYPEQLHSFLKRGGVLAWGIVPSIYPSPDQIERESVDSLVSRFEAGIEKMTGLGIDEEILIDQSMVTPTCGTGSMRIDLAEKCLDLTGKLSMALKQRYFGEK